MKKIPGTIYRVGGYVRDALMNIPSQDIDYLVVGASPQAMLDAGFRQVGADFPVFLHPETQDEYALARTERKSGAGYHGFTVYAAPDVTLEEDLNRRDFTMNAMAMTDEGKIIDPYGGIDDLQHGVLRHVSEAFSDDPLRVIRGARFAARYGFKIHDDTYALMQSLCDHDKLKEIPSERVRAEFEKAAKSPRLEQMWATLLKLGAIDHFLPDFLQKPNAYHWMGRTQATNPDVLWGFWLGMESPKLSQDQLMHAVEKMRLSSDAVYVARIVQERSTSKPIQMCTPKEVTDMWVRCDVRRRKDLFLEVMRAWDHATGNVDAISWESLDKTLRSVNEGAIATTIPKGSDFKTRLGIELEKARIHALETRDCECHQAGLEPC